MFLSTVKAITTVYGERVWPFPCTESFMNRFQREQGAVRDVIGCVSYSSVQFSNVRNFTLMQFVEVTETDCNC